MQLCYNIMHDNMHDNMHDKIILQVAHKLSMHVVYVSCS